MKKFLAVAAVAALTLSACGTAPVEGEVVGKAVEISFKRKKPKTCFELTIKPASGDRVELCVPKSTYDRYNIGDKYP